MRYLLAIFKAMTALLVTIVILFMPIEGLSTQIVSVGKVIVAFACLFYIGKLLYDTLFYRPYIP